MSMLRRVVYMGLGALLMLGLVIGGAAVFAQRGDEADEGTTAQDERITEGEEGLEPELRAWRLRARGALEDEGNELLAEALGISVEELAEARSEARAARLEALVEAGVLTQAQADLIAAREAVAGYVDWDALAATAQAAYEAAIDAALEEGVITQAQADVLLENAPAFGLRGFGGGRGHHGGGHGFGPQGGAFAPGA